MRNTRINFLRAALFHKLSRGSQRACGLSKIIDQEHVVAFDLADEVQRLRLSSAAAFLCHDGEISAERLCVGRSHLEPAEVRRNDHGFSRELLSQIFNQYGERIEMIHRNVEEALHLLGM